MEDVASRLLRVLNPNGGSAETDPSTAITATAHVLHKYPLGPGVRKTIDRSIIEAYAELIDNDEFPSVIAEAAELRRSADADDPRVTVVKTIQLSPV